MSNLKVLSELCNGVGRVKTHRLGNALLPRQAMVLTTILKYSASTLAMVRRINKFRATGGDGDGA